MSKNIFDEVSFEEKDPFYSRVQDGSINLKCSKELEEAIKSAANQLGKKHSDLVRTIVRQFLVAYAKNGIIDLPQVRADSAKKASGL